MNLNELTTTRFAFGSSTNILSFSRTRMFGRNHENVNSIQGNVLLIFIEKHFCQSFLLPIT